MKISNNEMKLFLSEFYLKLIQDSAMKSSLYAFLSKYDLQIFESEVSLSVFLTQFNHEYLTAEEYPIDFVYLAGLDLRLYEKWVALFQTQALDYFDAVTAEILILRMTKHIHNFLNSHYVSQKVTC